MVRILGPTGIVVSRSRNLAGLRRYARRHPIDAVYLSTDLTTSCDGKGWLYVLFQNGAECQTSFASYRVLAGWVRRWRSAYGAELWIGTHQQETPLCHGHASLRFIEQHQERI